MPFKDELGTIKLFSAELNVDPLEKRKFFKVCTVPFALRSAIENELDRLEKHSEWATPIEAVSKPDGQVQLCGDFMVTVNQIVTLDQYPLQKVEDLLAISADLTTYS